MHISDTISKAEFHIILDQHQQKESNKLGLKVYHHLEH